MEKKNYGLTFIFYAVCVAIVFVLSLLDFNTIERIIINLLLIVFSGLLVYTPLSFSLKEWYYYKQDLEKKERLKNLIKKAS